MAKPKADIMKHALMTGDDIPVNRAKTAKAMVSTIQANRLPQRPLASGRSNNWIIKKINPTCSPDSDRT